MGKLHTTLLIIILIYLKFTRIYCYKECGKYEFECHTNDKCIAVENVCDGKPDCEDNSDEEDCEDCKAPEWHLCADGKTCIAASFLCDHEEHCPGGDDEESCGYVHVHRKCGKFEYTCSDQTCIALDLVCDGINDCPDKSDEHVGCDYAEANCQGFLCKNRKCLESHSWVCDGENDCEDGSDEIGCTRDCLLNKDKFLCKDNVTCIALSKVCDLSQDCADKSDEGGLCHDTTKTCSNINCPNISKCHVLPNTGPTCICPKGFNYDATLNKCLDINECLEYGICSQGCENLDGSYKCKCNDKFLMKSDNKTCTVPGDPLLLYSNSKSIVGVHLNTRHIFSIAQNLSQVIGVAFDGQHVYWTNIRTNRETISRCRQDGSHQEVILTSGLEAPEDLDIDWLTGNIYFTDSVMKHVAVCSGNGHDCTTLVYKNVENPRGIALDPENGMMYWSDWGDEAMIAKAKMDGSDVAEFVTTNIKWPNCIAIDHPNERLYWVDAKHSTIQSIKLDGTDRRTVISDILKHPYGIAVFANNLYWSDWETKSVHSCNKFTGKQHEIISKDKYIFDVHVYHSAVQPQKNHPCIKSGCSHLCLLAGSSFSCKCPDDMALNADQRTCARQVKKQKLYVCFGNYLLEIDHPEFGKHKILQTFNLPYICHVMQFNLINGKIIIADNIHKKIYIFDPRSKQTKLLVEKNLGNVTAISFDHLSQNVYWTDADRRTIEVLSLRNNHRAIAHFFSGTETPIGLVVMPEKGQMFVALKSIRKSHIDVLDMNGKGFQVHTFESNLGNGGIQLVFDTKSNVLFWLDKNNRKIEYSYLDRVSRYVFRSKLINPSSVAMIGDDILWTTRNSKTIFWTHNSNEGNTKSFDLNVITGGSNLEVFDDISVLSTQPIIVSDDHRCLHKNGGCSHVCISTGKYTSTCFCPPGMVFKNSENNTCIDSIDCEFKCKSGECLTSSRHCNGNKDCADGSDEDNCDESGNKGQLKARVICRYDQYTCHDSTQCIENSARCDKEFDCQDKSDELDCETLDHKTKCRFNQHLCDNGHCVDVTAICDNYNDCGDNSDEKSCAASHEERTQSCQNNMFQCTIGTCIPKSWECDGKPDCVDLSDEHEKCEQKACPKGSAQCQLGQCIDSILICDGHNDCGDNSDEQNCEKKLENDTCSAELDSYGDPIYFHCSSQPGKCVEIAAKCNGTAECPRGEDEVGCTGCNIFEFHCESKECILKKFRCDKEKDCADGSDEFNCDYVNETIHHYLDNSCSPGKFDCKDGSCIDSSRVCDGHKDCKDSADETDICKIACKDNPCDHECKATPYGAKCSCRDGYRLQADKKTCVDIDECYENMPCAQVCENVVGGHYCSCYDGFMIRPDKTSCKSVDNENSMIFASFDQIRKFSENPIMLKVLVSANDSRITGLDIDARQKKLYFTIQDSFNLFEYDLETGGLQSISTNGRSSKLAVDWVTGNIYVVVNNAVDILKVCNFKTRHCAQVVKFRPRDAIKTIAIDAYNRFLFYTITYASTLGSPKTQIYKARLDGSKVQLLTANSIYITAIEIDPYKKELYFVDANSKTLQSLNYVEIPVQSKVIIKHENAIKHPSGLSIFENDAYIINTGSPETVKCHLYGDRACHSFNLNVFNAEHIVIFGSSRQKMPNRNPCEKTDCSVICIPTEISSKCICSDGQSIQSGEFCNDIQEYEVGSAMEMGENLRKSSSSSTFLVVSLTIVGAVLIGLVGYVFYKRRNPNGSNFMINMHFQNPLLRSNYPSSPGVTIRNCNLSTTRTQRICQPIYNFLQGGKFSEVSLQTKSPKKSMKSPLGSDFTDDDRTDSIDLGSFNDDPKCRLVP